MGGAALDAAMSGNILLVIIVLAFMLVTSVLSEVTRSFGWRGKTERETRLAKELQEISRDGDMDAEVSLLKESISKRLRRAYGNGFQMSLKRVMLLRSGHFLATMAFMLLVGVFHNLLMGQYYASAEDWRTLGIMALFVLFFEIIMGVVYMVAERWYSQTE